MDKCLHAGILCGQVDQEFVIQDAKLSFVSEHYISACVVAAKKKESLEKRIQELFHQLENYLPLITFCETEPPSGI